MLLQGFGYGQTSAAALLKGHFSAARPSVYLASAAKTLTLPRLITKIIRTVIADNKCPHFPLELPPGRTLLRRSR